MRTAEQVRVGKRDYMRKVRANPVRRDMINAQRREHRERYAPRQKEYHRNNRETRLFYWRSRLFNAHHGVSYLPIDFARLWRMQRGLCELTGQKLTAENCHLDHRIPISRGGGHELSNLRWLTKSANMAKGNMLDAEFHLLCVQVAEWIGRRIMTLEPPRP